MKSSDARESDARDWYDDSFDREGAHQRVRVSLFGGLTLHADARSLEHRLSPGTHALVGSLLVDPQRSYPRETLVERLWPGLAPDMGRRRLSQALWQITRRLSAVGLPDFFDNSPATVSLSSRYEVRSDVHEFERFITEAESTGDTARTDPKYTTALERAVVLYRGEFLEGCYDDWSVEMRHRLHVRYRSALGALVRSNKAHGQLSVRAEPSSDTRAQ